MPGHCASQQQPEASHFQIKRACSDASISLPEMIRSFKKAVELWLADPTHKAKPYSLLAPEACAGPRPLGPCGWMLSGKMFRVHQPAVGTVILPGIYRILKDEHIAEKQSGRDSILFLTTGLPAPVAPELQDLLLKQLKAKTKQEAHEVHHQYDTKPSIKTQKGCCSTKTLNPEPLDPYTRSSGSW